MKVRLSTLVCLSVAVVSGTLLFWTSQRVQTSEAELRQIKSALAREKKTIRVLSAEWDYLNRPERLEELAQDYLRMVPPTAQQLSATTTDLPKAGIPVIPGRKPVMAAQPVAMTSSIPASPSAPSSDLPPVQSETSSFQSLIGTLSGDSE